MKQIKSKVSFDNIKFTYVAIYAVFLTLNKFVAFQAVPHGFISLCYNLLAAGGVVLLAVDFFTRRDMFRVPGNSLMLLYTAVIFISSIVNAQYGISSNIKTLVWTVIQIFLLTSLSWDKDREREEKRFFAVFHVISAVWLAGIVFSFAEFMVGYHGLYVLPEAGMRRRGFVDGRLFGEFTDPNVASVFSLCLIILTVFELVHRRTSTAMKIYAVINVVFQTVYVILSNSRTAMVIAVIVCFTGAVLILPRCLSRRQWHVMVKTACVAVAGVAASAVLIGSVQLLKDGLILLPRKNPAAIQQIQNIVCQLPTTVVPENGDEKFPSGEEDNITMDRPDIDEDSDISNNRFKIWSGYFDVFKCAPILGTSPRNALAVAGHFFPEGSYILQRQYSIHNGYLSILVCTGVIGAAVVAVWIFYVLKTVFIYLIRKSKARGRAYTVVVALTLVELALAISAFFMMGLFFGNSILELLFWYAMGKLLCTIRADAPELFLQEPLTYRITNKIFHGKRKAS